MAFTNEQEAGLLTMLSAFGNAKRLNDLPSASGSVSDMRMIVQDETGETKQMPVIDAIENARNPIAGRYWDETLSTPTAAGYYGSLEALKELPKKLGLGRYLVTDDRVRRKLDPLDSTKFEDGSVAALDGTMGQCMWCWNAHYFTSWKDGNYTIEVITFSPITGKKSVYVPAGGISWLGAGVMDRTTTKLASVISNDVQYRGGNNVALSTVTYPKLSESLPQCSMLGMPASSISTHNFGVAGRARGTGWEANWFVARAVVEYAERIILGTRHIQAAYNAAKDANGLYQGGLGSGASEMPDWTGFNGVSPIIPTSAGLAMGDGVGIETYTVKDKDAVIVYAAPVPVFFGLVHAGYGHLWSGIRGLLIDAGATKTIAYVAPSMFNVFDDTTTNGLLRAAELPRNAGYIKKLSTNLLCGLPTEVGATTATYFADYLYTDAETSQGFRVRLAGGGSNTGATAGSSYSNANTSASYADSHISASLCYFEADPKISA
ncbi:MAG: hypothetical protein RR182_06770 [Alistipes sp.]